MTINLMHKLLDVSSYIFEEMTDQMSSKDIGNLFWKWTKTKFLNDNVKKMKVTDFIYEYILTLDPQLYKTKYGINLNNIKKSKTQLIFISEIISKIIKHSDIQLIDF